MQRSYSSRRLGAEPTGATVEHVHSDEQPGPDQIQILRRMTPEQRWRAAHQLYWSLRRHQAAFLRDLHPEWSDEQVERETRRIFLHARS
jgi:hypothetical protein